jgi:hypothetical protein
MAKAASLEDQYTLACAADRALRANFASFPPLSDAKYDYTDARFQDGPLNCVPHSRYVWGMLMPASTVLVFRVFLGRAYANERFLDVRKVSAKCVQLRLKRSRFALPPPARLSNYAGRMFLRCSNGAGELYLEL